MKNYNSNQLHKIHFKTSTQFTKSTSDMKTKKKTNKGTFENNHSLIIR